jgi:hypothetical protein
MSFQPNQRRLVYGFALTALLIAVAALWLPASWRVGANRHGEWAGATASVAHVELGALHPLRLTWESSPSGFWLSFTAIRVFPLFVTLTLTIAAAVVARRIHRLRRLSDGGAGPD